jgi:hypothetical protein
MIEARGFLVEVVSLLGKLERKIVEFLHSNHLGLTDLRKKYMLATNVSICIICIESCRYTVRKNYVVDP